MILKFISIVAKSQNINICLVSSYYNVDLIQLKLNNLILIDNLIKIN